jgi:hypothetical protein
VVRHPVVVVIVPIETVNGRPLIVAEERAKHLLKTAVKIVFLEINMDFNQPICAGYQYSKFHSV